MEKAGTHTKFLKGNKKIKQMDKIPKPRALIVHTKVRTYISFKINKEKASIILLYFIICTLFTALNVR